MTKEQAKGGFLYRLFFTRDDDLDLLQVMFLLCILFFFAAFALVASGVWKVDAAAWEVFRWVFGVLAVTGVPTWLAAIIAKMVGAPSPLPTPDVQQNTDGPTAADEEEIG